MHCAPGESLGLVVTAAEAGCRTFGDGDEDVGVFRSLDDDEKAWTVSELARRIAVSTERRTLTWVVGVDATNESTERGTLTWVVGVDATNESTESGTLTWVVGVDATNESTKRGTLTWIVGVDAKNEVRG